MMSNLKARASRRAARRAMRRSDSFAAWQTVQQPRTATHHKHQQMQWDLGPMAVGASQPLFHTHEHSIFDMHMHPEAAELLASRALGVRGRSVGSRKRERKRCAKIKAVGGSRIMTNVPAYPSGELASRQVVTDTRRFGGRLAGKVRYPSGRRRARVGSRPDGATCVPCTNRARRIRG